MGQKGCSETSVQNYHCTLCHNPEEGRSRQHGGGSLKPHLDGTCLTRILKRKLDFKGGKKTSCNVWNCCIKVMVWRNVTTCNFVYKKWFIKLSFDEDINAVTHYRLCMSPHWKLKLTVKCHTYKHYEYNIIMRQPVLKLGVRTSWRWHNSAETCGSDKIVYCCVSCVCI